MQLTRRGAVRLAGATGPAAGTAGHSFVGSGNYTVDDDLDFLAGQSGWLFCNRCAGLFYGGSNTAGVGPAGPGGHSISLSGSDFHALDVKGGGGQTAASAWVTPCTPLRLVNGWTNASNHNPVPFTGPSGLGEVQAENHFSQAQCSTSLDGASFARSALA
jgi:hypothetical protein